MEQLINKNKIIAIMRHIPLEITLEYTRAVYDGGVRMLEIALNSEHALAQIEMISREFGGKLHIGAGTAVSVELVKQALDKGATYMLTPSSGEKVLEYCAKNDVPLLPGVFTPTDVELCTSYGFHMLKLFPANMVLPGYIKALQGPFDTTNYVAVGGVTLENAKSFFDSGFKGVGIASNLIPKELVAQNRWDEAAKLIAAMAESCKADV